MSQARRSADAPALGPEHPRRRFCEAFEATFDRPARFSHRRWGERFDRALRRLDRYAHLGAGRTGAGLEVALALITAHAEDLRSGERTVVLCQPVAAPASAAYFVPELERISKDWRRAHRPRIKAERRRIAQARKQRAAA